MNNEMITDYAGNTYPAALLESQETPGFDSFGARKDRAWQALGEIMNNVANDVPKVGDRVAVTKGRKHKGKTGIVVWRGRNPFERPSRYGSDMQRAMREAMGFGDRLGIRTDETDEQESGKFFTDLKNCTKTEGK